LFRKKYYYSYPFPPIFLHKKSHIREDAAIFHVSS
jgi:hypothetical protein